ncbi:flagellar protein FlaG [Halobacillus sp. A1]|uniref:flagellar protein FlaG n=1 Tax=Halobacillus sp. A1 TaxID=2880262 RepID=UPI0020A66BA8|nr:flagellar protein FlaG [Halobacillus sp. A1]
MDVKKSMTQSQLLHRSTIQLSDISAVQENLKQIQKEKDKSTPYLGGAPDKLHAGEIIAKMNELLDYEPTSLRFEMHDKLDEYYVTIVDMKTREVVKEIPPKKMLDYYGAMAEFLGFIVDDKI